MMNIYKPSCAFLKHHPIIILLSSILYLTTCPYSIPYCRPSTNAPLFCQPNLSLFSAPLDDCFFCSAWSNLPWRNWQHFSWNLDALCNGNNPYLWHHPGPQWLTTPPQFPSSLGTALQEQFYNFCMSFFLSYSQWCTAILKIPQRVSEGWTMEDTIN